VVSGFLKVGISALSVLDEQNILSE
jgi:hypothetical protein